MTLGGGHLNLGMTEQGIKLVLLDLQMCIQCLDYTYPIIKKFPLAKQKLNMEKKIFTFTTVINYKMFFYNINNSKYG